MVEGATGGERRWQSSGALAADATAGMRPWSSVHGTLASPSCAIFSCLAVGLHIAHKQVTSKKFRSPIAHQALHSTKPRKNKYSTEKIALRGLSANINNGC